MGCVIEENIRRLDDMPAGDLDAGKRLIVNDPLAEQNAKPTGSSLTSKRGELTRTGGEWRIQRL